MSKLNDRWIGINTDYRANVKGRTPHSYMHSGYYDCILSANALPVMIPPLIKEHDLAPILDRLDGVLLTGGDDLDPKKMGLAPHPSVTVMPERRETADRLLCKLIQQARKMPVLGKAWAWGCRRSTSSTAAASSSISPRICPRVSPTATRRGASIAIP